MPAKLTTEEFIRKSINVHGTRYDYSKVIYEGNRSHVIIICEKHGEFNQTPMNHLNKQGCPKCGRENVYITVPDTEDIFISKSINKHGSKYDYSHLSFSPNSKKVIIGCYVHGDFTQQKDSHIQGHGCPRCATEAHAGIKRKDVNSFIKEAVLKHGDMYDYSMVKYINNKEKIAIICPYHGVFHQTPSSHILQGSGCNKCVRENNGVLQRKSTENFIKDSISIHGNRYSYLKTEYICSWEKVIITCSIHGDFYVTPTNHLSGCGCVHCTKAGSPHIKKNWINRAGNKLGVFYIIHCFGNDESFYKMGITFNSLKNRYQSKTAMPYNYEVVRLTISSDKEYIWDLEKRFNNFKKQNQYYPKISFAGSSSECFSDYTYKKEKQE